MPRGRAWRKRNRRRKGDAKDKDTESTLHQKLLQWAISKGFDKRVSKLKPYVFQDTGRGMICRKALPPGSKLISIPECLLISSCVVLKTEIGQIISRCWPMKLNAIQVLCAFLLMERCRGHTSDWVPYLRSLPESYTTPCYWSYGDLAALPYWTRHEALKQIQELKKSFGGCRLLFEELNVILPGFTNCSSFEDYRWAWYTVNTRAVYMSQKPHPLLDGSPDTLALAPVLDLLNHSVHVQVKAGFNEKSRNYEIYTEDAVSRWSQAFIHYGPHNNSKLLVEYGFCVPQNPHNHVPFDIDDLVELARKENVDFIERRVQIICDVCLHQKLCCSLEGVSWNLRACALLFLLLASQLAQWRTHIYAEDIDSGLDKKVNYFLCRLLKRKITDCRPPEKADAEGFVRKMIISLCEEYQAILNHCISTVT